MSETLMRWLSGPGFLGTRAPLFPDLVVAALVLVVPALLCGVVAARRGRRRVHAHLMGWTYAVLAVVVTAFIAWNRQGGPPASPALEGSALYRAFYLPFVTGHIIVALSALGAGGAACLHGLLRARAVTPGGELAMAAPCGRRHRLVGRAAVVLLTLTSVSGCVIYYLRYLYAG